jgi:glycerol-3-phosphate dehydrogenase (NAD(P)+)
VKRISIVGAGAWGTALGIAAFRAGHKVILWSIYDDEVEVINQHHENKLRLPGIALDPHIQGTTFSHEILPAEAIILCPPAQFMRSTCETFQKVIPANIPLVIASKGIENNTSLLMSQVVREFFPNNPLLILSGPSFAHDVAQNLPTAVALASENLSDSQSVAALLSSRYFRLYATDDMIGTQLGGACKNIIAIACGICEGRGWGDNTRAAVLSRGLAEIARLGCSMGAKLETFLGLAGVGDIALTSMGAQSRNKTFGVALGQGASLKELLETQKTLTEGVHTVSGTVALAKKYNLEMPLTFAMYELLHKGKDVDILIEGLLSRPLKGEGA